MKEGKEIVRDRNLFSDDTTPQKKIHISAFCLKLNMGHIFLNHAIRVRSPSWRSGRIYVFIMLFSFNFFITKIACFRKIQKKGKSYTPSEQIFFKVKIYKVFEFDYLPCIN